MVIITQNKQAMWRFDDITRLRVTGTGTGIQAVAQNGSGGEIAKYRNRNSNLQSDADTRSWEQYGRGDGIKRTINKNA